jgi:hypothetical protein
LSMRGIFMSIVVKKVQNVEVVPVNYDLVSFITIA